MNNPRFEVLSFDRGQQSSRGSETSLYIPTYLKISASEMVIDQRTHNTDSISQSEYIYYSSKWLYTYRNPIDRRCFHRVHFPIKTELLRVFSVFSVFEIMSFFPLKVLSSDAKLFGRQRLQFHILHAENFCSKLPKCLVNVTLFGLYF